MGGMRWKATILFLVLVAEPQKAVAAKVGDHASSTLKEHHVDDVFSGEDDLDDEEAKRPHLRNGDTTSNNNAGSPRRHLGFDPAAFDGDLQVLNDVIEKMLVDAEGADATAYITERLASVLQTAIVSSVRKLAFSSIPSVEPSLSPSTAPSDFPSASQGPSSSPTVFSSESPSSTPSSTPTASQYSTASPSLSPSDAPSKIPSQPPSISVLPSYLPVIDPSISPSIAQSTNPTGNPSKRPSDPPSSIYPSREPFEGPSAAPSLGPSLSPSTAPTGSPSVETVTVKNIFSTREDWQGRTCDEIYAHLQEEYKKHWEYLHDPDKGGCSPSGAPPSVPCRNGGSLQCDCTGTLHTGPTCNADDDNEDGVADALVDFKGITDAFSVDKGIIMIDWDGSILLELGNVSFNVFVALDEYNYTFMLESMSVEDLVDAFTNEPTFQHFEVSDIDEISVETPYLGRNHSLLVKAQFDGAYSDNTLSKIVGASTSDPHIRDDVGVVGVFFPTSRLDILVEDVPHLTEHTLSFIGPVSTQSRDLIVGDIITGFSTDFDPFSRRVLAIIENEPNMVVLRVVGVGLDEIFDALDLDSSFEVARATPVSGRRRKLFLAELGHLFDQGAHEFNKHVMDPLKKKFVDPIGDAFTGVVDVVEDLFDDGQLDKDFTYAIVDVNQKWDFSISASTNSSGPIQIGAKLSVKGHASADVSLNGKVRVEGFLPVFARIEAKAELSVGSTLSATAGPQRTYEKSQDLWKTTFSRIVMVGKVPVQLYASPSLVFGIEATVSATASAKVGFSVKAGTSVALTYENGGIRHQVVPPRTDFDRDLPTLEGTTKFVAGAGITLKVDAGLYGGLAEASVGLKAGLTVNMEGGLKNIGDDFLPSVTKFDLGVGFSIPLSATFLFKAFTLAPGSPVWEKKWLLITLPSAEFKVLDDHRCLQGDNGGVASFALGAKLSYPNDVLFDNPVQSSDWSMFPVEEWSLDPTTTTEASFERTGLVSSSPEPDGTVTIALQAKVPPFFKVIKTVALDSLFPPDPVPCTQFSRFVPFAHNSLVVGDGDHWLSNWWLTPRLLERSGGVDPFDCRVVLKGKGKISTAVGTAVVTGSPRLYIFSGSRWGDIDMSAYVLFRTEGDLKPYSGFTFGARTNHDQYVHDGCSAATYYARIYWQTGELAFQKEYYHDQDGHSYSDSNRVNFFVGGVPLEKWIGMRFLVISQGDSVGLALYLDEEGDGNWVLRHSMLDQPSSWMSPNGVPPQCPQKNGDPILRHGNACFLRADGSDETTVLWRDAKIQDLSGGNGLPKPRSCWCENGTMHSSLDYCCDECNGQCGGTGCSDLPGGNERCCSSNIAESDMYCSDPSDTACIIP